MKNILITGSDGFIARNLIKKLNNYNIIATNRNSLNLNDTERVQSFVKSNNFDVIINTATYGGNRLLQDDYSWVYYNCLMLYNFFEVKDYYGKLIHFGSGAELDRSRDINESSDIDNLFPKDPYGMSKNIIYHLTKNINNFYNLRIFNVFNEDELITRMMRSSITNYINRKPIKIFQNKYMDFFHFDDFQKLIEYYINNDNCPNSLNCSYDKKYSLLDISMIINNLSDYNVPVEIENPNLGKSYTGKYDLDQIPIKFGTLEKGINSVYNNLICH